MSKFRIDELMTMSDYIDYISNCEITKEEMYDLICEYNEFLNIPLNVSLFDKTEWYVGDMEKINPVLSGLKLEVCTPKIGDIKTPFVGVTAKKRMTKEQLAIVGNTKSDEQWCGGWENFISSYLYGNKTIGGLAEKKQFVIKILV